MFIAPDKNTVRWSFTWVQNVTYDPTPISAEVVNDTIQCADPSSCPGATSVDGVSIKAADFAKCGFSGLDENDKPLNPKNIIAGSDIKVRCDQDKVQLLQKNITNWTQGLKGFDMNGPAMADIRQNGFPNNTHVRQYPFDCMLGAGRVTKLPTASKKMNWNFMILSCDQQFNGLGTFHKLSMVFELNKSLARRRLTGSTAKGAEGTFGYNMNTGKCIKKDANDTTCPADTTGSGTGFAFLASVLALFALQ